MKIQAIHRFHTWVASWLDIVCGILSVVTFCFYRPWWDFKYRGWAAKRALRKRIKELNNK